MISNARMVCLTTAQIRALLEAASYYDGMTHPARARSLRYAAKTLRSALGAQPPTPRTRKVPK
jgi:hypothetical protein